MANLYHRLSGGFPRDSASPFATLPDGSVMRYCDVETMSARMANLLSSLGVVSGDRVAVQAPKSIEMVMLYLACLRSGAVFLPLNPAYTAPEVEYFIRDANPFVFICDPDRYSEALAMADRLGSLRVETLGAHGDGSLPMLAAGQAASFATVAVGDDDLAAILYTSGTTGRSKGAMLSHDNLGSNCFTLRDLWRFTHDDVLIHALPIFHTHGLFVAINIVLAAGSAMIFQPEFNVNALFDALPDATCLMGVPTFYTRLLQDDRLTAKSVAHMRLFVSGSAPLSAQAHRDFEQRTGHAILERYGMTETGMNTSNPYDGRRIGGTVGLPLPDVTIRIADPETGNVLAQDNVGVIEIKGPNVFQGYWNQPEKTAAEFRDGHFISGDLGKFDDQGYVSIIGRVKDLIISGGYNIYPAEIEAALAELPEVRESAVIGVPHPDLGEAVVAVIVAHNAEVCDPDALTLALSKQLARFKQPRRFVFVDALPRNAMGKVQKAAMRETYRDLLSG